MKQLQVALVWLILATGCQQTEKAPCTQTKVTIKAPDEEIRQLRTYIETSHTIATVDSRGFYFTIQRPGSGKKPTVCSNVTVNYVGKLTNGKSFDSAEGISFDLNQLIVGWQEGIPLIAPGGSITLFLPPSLAYGAQEQNDIPANSILIFQIDLVSVN